MADERQKNIVLAGLSAAGQNATLSPVQTQKLFFIIDREIPTLINGARFDFEPYDYGPFDKTVYEALEELSMLEFVQIQHGRYNLYTLTPQGYAEGLKHLNGLPIHARKFIADTASWVRSLSFEQLVAAIYKKYPDMKENSIFQS